MAPASRSRLLQREESEDEATHTTQRDPGGRVDSENASDSEDEQAGYDAMDVDGESDSQDQVVKKLVRYVLACEFQRIPIKRVGISDKVLGKQRGSFKRAFDAAQEYLRSKFGMEMMELPVREKVTIRDKRAAAKSKSNSKPTASYILVTTLPPAYRNPGIIAPSLIGSEEDEATYIGLCTVLVSYIGMSPGGQVPDHKLMRILRRLDVEENTPLEKTAVVLQKMIKQGYIWRVTDRSGDEETIDWRVGSRGRVEIGNNGISGFVKEIYGENAPEDLDKRLQRSLGMEIGGRNGENQEDEEQITNGGSGTARSSGRRRRVADDDADD